MTLPNFLVIGAAKAGTTSLWSHLRQHPECFLPDRKEPNYYAYADRAPNLVGPASPHVLHELLHRRTVTDRVAYERLFDPAGRARAVGEASVRYLYLSEAADRIARDLPDVKLVAVLRHPVDRLISHHRMNVQYGLEPLGLADAVDAEDERRAAGWGWDWHYVAVGRYLGQLERYVQRFGRDRLLVLLYDEFLNEPAAVYRRLCRFLDIADDFEPDRSARGKPSYRPRNVRLHRMITRASRQRARAQRVPFGGAYGRVLDGLSRLNSGSLPPVGAGLRRELGERFRSEVEPLERLVGQPIPWFEA